MTDAFKAIHVLSHESWHLAGVRDEGITECYAVQTDAAIARRFGAGDEAAEAVVGYALSLTALRPEYHRPSQCRPGGRYDLHPETAAWPSG